MEEGFAELGRAFYLFGHAVATAFVQGFTSQEAPLPNDHWEAKLAIYVVWLINAWWITLAVIAGIRALF